MKCHDCNVEVEKTHYPEGECPNCGLTYTLPDSEWPECEYCGEVGGDPCLDCLIEKT